MSRARALGLRSYPRTEVRREQAKALECGRTESGEAAIPRRGDPSGG